MKLSIIKATATTIQDAGRFGYAHLGITQGGVADEYAFHWSNKLLNNPYNSAVIETTFGGFAAKIEQNVWLAITGALDSAFLDGQLLPNWSRFFAMQGQILTIKPSATGLRHYIAVQGGLSCQAQLGSRATVFKDRLGGLNQDGQPLRAGDRLNSNKPQTKLVRKASVEPRYRTAYQAHEITTLRVILGSQASLFTESELSKLFGQTYRVGTQSNKMGYQFEGNAIQPPKVNLTSEGITLGSIQIPPSGIPIIMLCERQTIGGYLKIGNIARIDLGTLAQCRPGQSVRLIPCLKDTVASEYTQWLKFFQN